MAASPQRGAGAQDSKCLVCLFEGHWTRACPCTTLQCERSAIRLAQFCPGLAAGATDALRLYPPRDLEAGIDFPADGGGRGGPAFLRWCLAHIEVEFVALLSQNLDTERPMLPYRLLSPFIAQGNGAAAASAPTLVAVEGVGAEWATGILSESPSPLFSAPFSHFASRNGLFDPRERCSIRGAFACGTVYDCLTEEP